jgi:hypothetical protein
LTGFTWRDPDDGMASGWYNSGARDVADRTIDLVADTLKLILVTSSYTPDPDHDFAADLTNELSGTGYTGGFNGSGRKTLAGKAFSTDTTNNRVLFTFSGVLWTAINAGNPKYGIIVKEITNDAATRLVGYLDLGTVVTNGGDLTITPDATLKALYMQI